MLQARFAYYCTALTSESPQHFVKTCLVMFVLHLLSLPMFDIKFDILLSLLMNIFGNYTNV